MRIVGVDPGYDRLGLAIIERPAKGKDVLLYSGCFRTSPEEDISSRFRSIGGEIGRILEGFKPDAMALETLFVTNNRKTAMRVAEARGIIIYEAAKRGIPTSEYGPTEIKTAVAGDGRADKARMTKMVRLLIDMPDKKTVDDEYDAVAVAVAHLAVRGSGLSTTAGHCKSRPI